MVYRPAGMARLKDLGPVVYLNVPPAVLAQRLGDLDRRGVIHAPGQSIADLDRERDPLYRRHADHVIDCGDLSPEPVARRIMAALVCDYAQLPGNTPGILQPFEMDPGSSPGVTAC